MLHVEFNGNATVVAEMTPGLVSNEDRAFPVSRAVRANLKVGDHAAYRVEKLLVEVLHSVEVVVMSGVGKLAGVANAKLGAQSQDRRGTVTITA